MGREEPAAGTWRSHQKGEGWRKRDVLSLEAKAMCSLQPQATFLAPATPWSRGGSVSLYGTSHSNRGSPEGTAERHLLFTQSPNSSDGKMDGVGVHVFRNVPL